MQALVLRWGALLAMLSPAVLLWHSGAIGPAGASALAALAVMAWAALARVRHRRRRHGPLRYVQMGKQPIELG